MRSSVVSRKTRFLAAALAAPFVVLVVVGPIVFGPAALAGSAFFTGLVILPIGLAVWMGIRAGRRTDVRLKRRARSLPRLPRGLEAVEDTAFDPASINLPLFSRPLANLWTRVLVVHYEGVALRRFDLIHADMLGEGSLTGTGAGSEPPGIGAGMSVVSCALALVKADMPLVVVRPRYEKAFTLPAGMRQYSTELGSFNRAFRLFSEDAFAATAIIDPRTIEAIQRFDPGTAIEIGGPAVVVYTSRRRSSLQLIRQAAGLARTFPKVVSSLFPAARPREARNTPKG